MKTLWDLIWVLAAGACFLFVSSWDAQGAERLSPLEYCQKAPNACLWFLFPDHTIVQMCSRPPSISGSTQRYVVPGPNGPVIVVELPTSSCPSA